MQEKNNQENQKNEGGRKPKNAPAVHRYGIKLISEENDRFNQLFAESGMRQNARFIKKAIWTGESRW